MYFYNYKVIGKRFALEFATFKVAKSAQQHQEKQLYSNNYHSSRFDAFNNFTQYWLNLLEVYIHFLFFGFHFYLCIFSIEQIAFLIWIEIQERKLEPNTELEKYILNVPVWVLSSLFWYWVFNVMQNLHFVFFLSFL